MIFSIGKRSGQLWRKTMNSKDNYPKAIAVYEAVLRLLQDKRDLSALTVSEIAKEAGVGKGTTYEYFSSKEEIIEKSLMYGYDHLIGEALKHMDRAETLKEKLETVAAMAKCSEHACALVISEELRLKCMDSLAEALKEAACEEGLAKPEEKEYVKWVFMTAIQGMIGPVHRKMIEESHMSEETYLEYLYQMVLRSLGKK
ncbi:MAG: TetR/AcrR family transcriptional regulator [Clostridia bacterium]|nr:TetR/AcrR family transcriptional regulator [Clostridia bacterium]